MFSVSGVSVKVTVTIPGAATSIDRYTIGAVHDLEVSNFFTIPIDIEVECGTSAGLVVFGSGPAWNRLVSSIPPKLTMVGAAFNIHEPVLRSAVAGTGSDVISCHTLRYRWSGAGGWNPDHHPPSGHTVMVSVV